MEKLFSVFGTSRKNGTLKFRFANDPKREKAMEKDGQTDIIMVDIGTQMTKVEGAKILLSLPPYQEGEARIVIEEFLKHEGVDLTTITTATVIANDEPVVEPDTVEIVGSIAEEVVNNDPADEPEVINEPEVEPVSEEDEAMLDGLMQTV